MAGRVVLTAVFYMVAISAITFSSSEVSAASRTGRCWRLYDRILNDATTNRDGFVLTARTRMRAAKCWTPKFDNDYILEDSFTVDRTYWQAVALKRAQQKTKRLLAAKKAAERKLMLAKKAVERAVRRFNKACRAADQATKRVVAHTGRSMPLPSATAAVSVSTFPSPSPYPSLSTEGAVRPAPAAPASSPEEIIADFTGVVNFAMGEEGFRGASRKNFVNVLLDSGLQGIGETLAYMTTPELTALQMRLQIEGEALERVITARRVAESPPLEPQTTPRTGGLRQKQPNQPSPPSLKRQIPSPSPPPLKKSGGWFQIQKKCTRVMARDAWGKIYFPCKEGIGDFGRVYKIQNP